MEYGLVGKNIGFSFSPYIHSCFGYDYRICDMAEEELEGFFAERDFCGVNVTIPYKTAVVKYMDELDDTAKKCGCVNTVHNDNGRLIGYNTDYAGLERALDRADIELKGKRIVICGSGGAGQTAYALCTSKGAKQTVIASRKGSVNYDNLYKTCLPDIVINATPVGTTPRLEESPVDLSRFGESPQAVFDLVYNPLSTALLEQAEDLGIRRSNGLFMLVGQACKAAEIFLKDKIKEDECEQIYKNLQKKVSNIVLVGMPGCGKSTIGRRIAEATGRRFFDVDEVICKRTERSIESLFAERGEEGFRKTEKEVVRFLAEQNGAVIATGGGSVLDPKNVRLLKRNGFFVWIDRETELLDSVGRPLLSDKLSDRLELFSARKHIYEACADIKVDNNGSIDDAAKETAASFFAR